MNLSSNVTPLLARALVLLSLSSLFLVTSPPESDAQVCTHGSIADACVGDRYCYHGDDPLGCYPAPPVAPPINCNDRNFGLRPPATIRGSVRGPGGVGVKDACVYWKANWGWASTHSDAQGLFAIDVAADSPSTVIYVAKPYMTWASSEVAPLEYLSDPAKRLDLSIAFTNQAYIKPWAINSTVVRELSVELYSAAPTQTVRSLIEFEGLLVELTHDIGFSETWSGMQISRWKGTLHTSAGLSEGARRYQTCLLSSGSTGGCATPDGIIYSPVPPGPLRALLVVDNTPPSQGVVNPKNLHNTVDTTPPISISPVDSLSGPDTSRTQMFLDGTSLSSGNWGLPQQQLSPGVHSVTATIWDLAGNSSEVSWRFAVTTLSGGPATVTVTPQTKKITESVFPSLCCHYVTFNDVETRLSSYNLELGGSPLMPGTGSIARPVQHLNLKVTFKSAAQEVTIDVPYYSSAFTSKIAVLEPTAETLETHLPGAKSKIFGLGVTVPSNFVVTQDSTATVWADVQELPGTSVINPDSQGEDPLPNELPIGGDPPVASISSLSGFRVDERDGALVVTTLPKRVHANVIVRDQDFQLLHLPTDPQGSESYSSDPTIKCGGVTQTSVTTISCVSTKKKLVMGKSHFTLAGTAGIALYSNQWLYRDLNSKTYIDWHQVAAKVSDACVQGRTILPKLTQFSTKSRQVLLNPEAQQSSWQIGSHVHSTGGTESETGSGRLNSTPELTWIAGNSILKQATYTSTATVTATPDDSLGGSVSSGTSWKHDPDEDGILNGVRDSIEQLVLGVSYESDQDAIEIWSEDVWWVEVSYASC